ncbi:MAG: RecQ family ATP-dependent DNA helicase [Bernardetiaceae bacterium]
MKDISEVLQQFWGYDAFRPLQREIIEAVLSGNDTLALMPTGGGKSICFQVPTLAHPTGLCLVVTPLIALMKDQVQQLQRRGIAAQAIFSGMSPRQIDITLDNCIYGDVRFLYLSPERLQTVLFRERLKKMKVVLLAIDEAHCISQWGYDFRPPYRQIADIRPLIPETPCIALTATATPKVCRDIEEKLAFRAGHRFFQKSFARANLAYAAFQEDDKRGRLLKILDGVPGSAVVYVRSRRKTQETAEFLNRHGRSADFYHAGLDIQTRNHKQAQWIQDQTRIMVATNAFGMGIDKPNVRLVVHLDMPDNLEAYYQEAGRAGRDEQKAYAVLLYQTADIQDMETQLERSHPSLETIARVYQAIANRFQIPVGSGELSNYPFRLSDLTKAFGLSATELHYSLQRLQEQGLLLLNEASYQPSQVMVLVSREDLYKFQIKHAAFDPLLKAIFRLYGGGELWKTYGRISEEQISKAANLPIEKVKQQLTFLHQSKLIDYQEQKNSPTLTLLTPRRPANALGIDVAFMNERQTDARKRLAAMVRYATHTQRCRTQLILDYFEETNPAPCGVCDLCLKQKKNKSLTDASIQQQILDCLAPKPLSAEALQRRLSDLPEERVFKCVRQLVATGQITFSPLGELQRAGR